MIRIKGHRVKRRELKLGIPVEMEHTTSRKRAEHIARQHLIEFPNYYSKGLIPMERRLKRIMRRKK
jgi:hypothetical protein